jgi:hypothetical protein
MSNSIECSTCGAEFESQNALNQHRNDKHTDSTNDSTLSNQFEKYAPRVLVGLLVIAAIGGLSFWVTSGSNSTVMPTQNDHWHADYQIILCGEKVPPQPYSQGGIHTHGKGQIHIHPHSPQTAGRNANLGNFFSSFNGSLTSGKISIPMVGTYENGDNCNGQPGEVVVYVNGEMIENPAKYVIQNGDNVRITFQSS